MNTDLSDADASFLGVEESDAGALIGRDLTIPIQDRDEEMSKKPQEKEEGERSTREDCEQIQK